MIKEDMTIEIKDVDPVAAISGLMTGIDALTKLIDGIDDEDGLTIMKNRLIGERKALMLMINDITLKRYGHEEFKEVE